ncbi:hypothetical protein RZE82_02830 [Mollicutes bacterium LVI A0039]|nr:hypothetical protein RZE82_02830 [Mollicutes bacterium LVI A0039]
MAQKTDLIFDSLYNPNTIDPNNDDLLDNEQQEIIVAEPDNKLKAENELEINGKSYHVSLD